MVSDEMEQSRLKFGQSSCPENFRCLWSHTPPPHNGCHGGGALNTEA